MRNLLIAAVIFMSSLTAWVAGDHSAFAGNGDTTVVQTFYYDTNMRAGTFIFPSDTNITYEKIIMLYSMRCKDGLISSGSNPNLGCGEWDYNCYTFLVDSTQTDSLLTISNSHAISNFSDTVFNYTTIPVYSYHQSNQQQVIYNTTINETTSVVGSGNLSLQDPFASSNTISRTQYLFTATELLSAGFTADSITGIRLDISSVGSELENLRINLKYTSQTTLDPALPEVDGFSEVYYLNTTFSATGLNSFNFYNNFWWDGTSNIIVEFTYTNASAGTNNDLLGHDAGYTAALVTGGNDNYLSFNSNSSYVQLNSGFYGNISDEITIAFWTYGDPDLLPANTYALEALDANNQRQINIHLPWSNSNVYWDCGNDGTGYDRINKAAAVNEFEGKWNFWAFTKNATTGSMKIYLNGALWHSGTGFNKLINIDDFIIGKGLNTNSGYYGDIDEFSVWNKELSQVSIAEIMFNDITPSHPDYSFLQAYHQFNENSGTAITDGSSNGNDAIIINPTRRQHNGNSLFRNFTASNERPNTVFVSGEYTTTVNSILVTDSLLVPPTSVLEYAIDATGHELEVINTLYVWPSGYAYIYDENGMLVDSLVVPAQSTINISQLNYYRVRPMYVELINFITPYGINLNMNGLIGKTWAFDVTDFAPVLKGPRHIEMRDGIYQEDIDIKFVFYEGTPPRHVNNIQQVWPSGSWVSPSYNDIMNDRYFYPLNVPLDGTGSMFKLRSAISGHGQQGEFIPRTHTLKLNNAINFARTVWTECAANPIYPQGGTWIYDRAGWCPGAAVDVAEYELTPNVTPGQTINLDYQLPIITSPGQSNYRVSNQLVTYGPVNFSLDASIDYVKSPSKRVEFHRLNPLCNEPVISIKNTGSTPLTSALITYGRVGGTMSTYNWSGNLGFLQSEEFALPQPDWTTSSTDEFVVYISQPNGSADQYAWNDTLYSEFNIPSQLPSGLVFDFKTNNYPTQNSYTLKDSQGNIILNVVGQTANTIYRDTVYLPNDCYTVHLTDAADDGLSFWANPSQGTGWFRIRDVTSNFAVRNYNGDFGDNIYEQFTIGYVLPVNEVAGTLNGFSIYPNPSSDIVTAQFSLPMNSKVKLTMVNVLGEEVMSETVVVSQETEKFSLDVSGFESGIYYIVAETDDDRQVRKLVVM